AAQHGEGAGEDRRGQNRQRAGNDRRDGSGEDREQMPCRGSKAVGHGPEPERGAETDNRRARDPGGRRGSHTAFFPPVIATGSKTAAICASVSTCFSRIKSRMPRPVRIASAAS